MFKSITRSFQAVVAASQRVYERRVQSKGAVNAIDQKTALTGSNLPQNMPASILDIPELANLKITSSATGIPSEVDLLEERFPHVISEMTKIGSFSGETVYFLTNAGKWVSARSMRLQPWLTRQHSSGYVELAVVSPDGALKTRVSIKLWRRSAGTLEAAGLSAPVKKVMEGAGPQLRAETDASIGPVDAVYTWVNSDDPTWREMIASFRDGEVLDNDRFAQVDELKYSIRSLFTFAPWIRKVFIFSNCRPPDWFKQSDRIRWIMHDEVIPSRYLPLFNSHSIETFLHDIPGLSERYVYFNDDVFLSAPVRPTDFFTAYGQSISRMEPSGIVHHLLQRVRTGIAEEWQCAAVNCAELIHRSAGVLPTRLHQHTPHALQQSVYRELEQAYPVEIEATRRSKFRQKTDYSFTSFLFHHFAAWKGKAWLTHEPATIVRSTNYKKFVRRKTYASQRFFCLNDGGGSSSDRAYQQFKNRFLRRIYPFKSPAEF